MKKSLKTLAICCLFTVIGIVIGSSSKRLLEGTFRYTNFSLEEVKEFVDHEVGIVINNGLKELSREEVVESYSSNLVKVVLDGKVENCINFEHTIRKEAEYFIKNYEKYPSFEDEYLNHSENTYRVKRRTIAISAEDMEMYAVFSYGKSEEGKLIAFDQLDNDVVMKKTPETTAEIEESDKQDVELRSLLLKLEKSLNEEYGGILYE